MAVVSPAELRERLKQTAQTGDGTLIDLIAEAQAAVARRVGPLEPVTVTERIRNASGTLTPKVLPVISLTSVTAVDGTAIDVNDLHVDPDEGVISFDDGSTLDWWAYDVVYSAGRPVGECPDDLKAAVKEMCFQLWKRRTGSDAKATKDDGGVLLDALVAEHEDLGI